MKTSLIRLPEKVYNEVEIFAQERGLAFATAVRCIVVEHMKEHTVMNHSVLEQYKK